MSENDKTPKEKEQKIKRIIIWAFWACFAMPVLVVLCSILWIWKGADIPSFEELESPKSNLATQVLGDDGKTVLSTFHIENRSYVTYEDLSPNLVNALVATEDVRFYEHSGIDFRSLARVIVKTLLGGDSSQGGGSTVSQQLAKTLYPTYFEDVDILAETKAYYKEVFGVELTDSQAESIFAPAADAGTGF